MSEPEEKPKINKKHTFEDSVAEVRYVREQNEAYYEKHGHHWYEACPLSCLGRDDIEL